MMSEQENQSPRRQPQQRQCDECGKMAALIPIYDQYNTDAGVWQRFVILTAILHNERFSLYNSAANMY